MRGWLAVLLLSVVACGKRPVGDIGAAPPPVCADAGTPAPSLASPAERWPRITKAEADARARAFRERNPGTWSVVEFGADGFVNKIETTDPCLAPPSDDVAIGDAELARWTALVLANGEAFGVDDAHVPWKSSPGDPTGMPIPPAINAFQVVDGQQLGWIRIHKSPTSKGSRTRVVSFIGHFWPGVKAPPPATIADADASKPYIGKTYAYTIDSPGMPCDPAPGTRPGPGCGQAPSQTSGTGTVTAGEIRMLPEIAFAAGADAFAYRRLLRVVLPHDGKVGGMPDTVDAVTGAVVEACNDRYRRCEDHYRP